MNVFIQNYIDLIKIFFVNYILIKNILKKSIYGNNKYLK